MFKKISTLFIIIFLSSVCLFSCKMKGYESIRPHQSIQNHSLSGRQHVKSSEHKKGRSRLKLSSHSTDKRERFSKKPPRTKKRKPKSVNVENKEDYIVDNEIKNDKIIIFFSRPGEQFEIGGVMDKGNTEIVADVLAAATGADVWRIKPLDVNRYPRSYKEALAIAKEELVNKVRPAYVGNIPDLSQYTTVFIGAPVWHDDWPMIVYTFFDNAKEVLKDKVLIPFCTHSGSGIAPLVSKLSAAFPDNVIKEGLAVRGVYAQEGPGTVRTEVNSWLKRLSL